MEPPPDPAPEREPLPDMEPVPGLTPAPPSPPAPVPVVRPRKRGLAWVAWLVILLAVALVIWANLARQERGSTEQVAGEVMLRMQARNIVGVSALNLPQQPPEEIFKPLRPLLHKGTPEQRLRVIAVAGDVLGPAEALKGLEELKADLAKRPRKGPDKVSSLVAILEKIYRAREKNPGQPLPVTDEERQELVEQLDWFGELALTPRDGPDTAARSRVVAPAFRALAGVLLFVTVAGTGFVAGVVLLFLAAVLVFRGALPSRLRLDAGEIQAGGIYAETFALYLVVYIGLLTGLAFLPAALVGTPTVRLALNVAAMAVTFFVVFWPVLRGVPWRQVRQDLGLHAGQGVGWEFLSGLAGYLATLPVLLLSVFVILGLAALMRRLGGGQDPLAPEGGGTPTHPVVEQVLQGGGLMWLEIFLLASVGAPLLEETMFRGVLYRHLRESSRWLRPAGSVAFSALFCGFLFAIIHPQGLLAVPALMTLGGSFALIREWRGSLLPSMFAHALNNGAVMTLLLLMAG